ncbi:VOC family protein [Calycomorphotria hydatis]|uniref:27 kDa antigen Cfp30B n=1 Tax=Calycomorphotria hydatis TaxID=2528027 RepID=A0A517T6K8_9PLAN|nr:VOC family protein [Calycomorphotria hydatis]QDT63998.1 27 kDa antigen Cfp30B [Calycomorphotria hydatis]
MGQRTKYAPGVFCWVDLMAKNAEEAQNFYTELMGWDAITQDTEGGPLYVIYQKDGKQLCGMGEMMPEMLASGMPAVWNSYVCVDDAGAVAAKATELGGTVVMPVMDVMTAGRMAGLQDPQGAYFFIWQPNEHIGAELVNESYTWGWNELMTKDADGSRQFYGDLFGWTFDEGAENGYQVIKHPEAGGGMNGGLLPMTPEMGDHPPCWCVYFSVDNLSATLEKLKSLGGTVAVPPMKVDVGEFSVVADPQGGHFNLIQLSVPADD